MMVIEYNNDRRKQNLRLDIYGGINIYIYIQETES